MRALLAAVLLSLAAILPLRAQSTVVLPDTLPLAPGQRELLRLERDRSAAIARHDTAFLSRLYAGDFRGITATGVRVDRDRLLYVFTLDDPGTVFTVDELEARLFEPGSAVVTGRLRAHTRAGELQSESRFIHVYVRRDDRWQIVAAQGTLMRPGGG